MDRLVALIESGKTVGVRSFSTSGKPIQEGRAASKSPHSKFGCFLSISQQVVSSSITKNSPVAICES